MQAEVVIAAVLILTLVVVGIFVVTRRRSNGRNPATSTRSRGPASLHYVCAGCSAQSTHSRRTIGAWEKGTRRFFCSDCHTKWRDKQPPRDVQSSASPTQGRERALSQLSGSTSLNSVSNISRPRLVPARSGCLTVIVVLVAVPVVITFVAAYA